VKFSVGASNNDFVLGSGNSESDNAARLDIKGKSVVVDASLKYQLKRSRVKNYAIGLAGSQIDSEIDLGEINSDFLDDSVRNIELFLQFDLLDEKNRILHQGNIGFTSSEFVKGANEEQDE